MFMRKWHRWLALVFGAFLLFIAITGVLSHLVPIISRGSLVEDERRGPPPAVATAAPAPTAPEGSPIASPGNGLAGIPPAPPRAAPNPTRRLVGYLHHLHSGEEFGPIGVVISLLSGFAMIFFSVSGLWLYYDMLVRRGKAGRKGLFWE